MTSIPVYQPFNKVTVPAYTTTTTNVVSSASFPHQSIIDSNNLGASNQTLIKYSFTPQDQNQYLFESFNRAPVANTQAVFENRNLQFSEIGQQADGETVKRSNKNANGHQNNQDDSSDDDNVQVLKFHKKKWNEGSIKLAQKTIEQLNNQVSLKETHLNQLIKQTDLKDVEIKILKAELSAKSVTSQQVPQVITTVPADYERIKSDILLLNKRNQELEQDNRSLAIHLEASNKNGDVEIWKRKCADLEKNLSVLTIQLSQSTNTLDSSVRERNIEINRLQEQYSRSQENLSRLEQENHSLQQELQTLKLHLQQNSNQSTQVSTLERQVSEQGIVINRQETQLNSTQLELENLRRALREREDRLLIVESQTRNSTVNQNQQFESLSTEIYNLSQQLKIKSQDASDLTLRCEALARDKEDLRVRLLREKDEELARAIRDRDEELKRVLNDRNEIDFRNRTIIEENRRLLAVLDSNTLNQSQQIESDRTISTLRSQIVQYQEQIRSLEAQLSQQRSELSITLQRTQQDLASRDTQISNLLRQISEYDASRRQEIERAIQDSESRLRQSQLETSNLAQQIKILSQDNADLQQKSSGLTYTVADRDSIIQQLRRQLAELSDENNKRASLAQALQEKDLVINSLRRQIAEQGDSNNRISQLELALREKDAALQRALVDTEQVRSSLSTTNDSLVRQLREKDTEISRLLTKDSRIFELEAQVNDWRGKFENSRNDILVICSETEKLKEILTQKENENIQLQQFTFIQTPFFYTNWIIIINVFNK